MPDHSQKETQDFIAEVREDNGGITAEDREFLEANRPSALRALQKTRRQLADSIKIVVDNLYSKETRFLYELIQNAEDNCYSIATANGHEPFIAFKLYTDRIIVDSNEDGFSESNIRAICSVGNSTKKHSVGYIGEKGIGFKSVFKIAQKVHVQSGPFSFAFSHTQENDDDGLGMITPYNEDAEKLPKGVRTRMTLTLLDSTKFEERASEFRDVPDTFLMFLSRLQRLSIELYPPGDAPNATQYSKRETKEYGLYTTVLTKTARRDKEESISEQKYYTMKNELRGLPFDEARKDKSGNSIDSATVILAFPVDEHDEPVLKPQFTYAFLPLRRVGFKFLIQADFITQANREDVIHSKRNQAVLKGVANAFADAVVVFCKRPSLRYHWMRYLPEESITDEFWRTLWPLIHEKLVQMPILEPWSGNGLYKPSELEKLSERVIAADQTPLLPDLKNAEIYLSPKYTEADFQILERLGTRRLQWDNFVDRLEADLRASGGSKWKFMKKNADWRTRICKVLLRVFSENLSYQQRRLRTLALIPLCDERWVSSDSGSEMYFPETHGINIPVDLGLDLVLPPAAQHVAWANLLSDLGVVSCLPEIVVRSINKRYNATNLYDFKLANAVAHIQYLYWFLPKDQSLAPQVVLANQYGSLLRKDQYLYFPDGDDDYSPSALFKQDTQLPGHPVNYLHYDYLKAVDREVMIKGRSWVTWLEEVARVRRIPELSAKDNDGLSKEFQYIINHRSNRLLGTLKRGWTLYGLQIDDTIKEELRNSAVLLENGDRISLRKTFLPLPRLKKTAAELGIADNYPFIAISELLRDGERLEWMFLKDLNVGIEEDLLFYLSALDTFKHVSPAINTASSQDRLVSIYRSIQMKCNEELGCVREVFGRSFIWIEPSESIGPTWLSTADCVWDGPQWLKSKQCLNLEYYRELEHLFKMSLEISDASQMDVVNDLLMLKSHTGTENAFNQSTPYTRTNIKCAANPYEFYHEKEAGITSCFQSITTMPPYKKQSFEEIRQEQYDIGTKPLDTNPLGTKPSPHNSKAFAGLKIKDITEEVEKRYEYLWHQHSVPMSAEISDSRKVLRSAFEDSALVYVPKENTWCPPSRCVWAESNIKIPGKCSIANAYPRKKTFFTTVLKISEPTVEMYIKSLKAEAHGKASITQMKETMALICGLGIGDADLSSLIEAKVLPVKLASGISMLMSASPKNEFMEFAIVENTVHRDAFKGKITVLDFSLEEIRDTRPLILALGLDGRFTSKLVKEVTDVKGGSQDHEMTRHLRLKSRAIVRCAFHFTTLNNRRDVASLYRSVKHASVYVSDSIRCSLQITQNERRIEGASNRANFHVEEENDALRLYLPKDEIERDVCFESDLPRRFCTFLGITDPGAPGVIGGVFRKNNLAVIDKILENAGVGQVDCDFTALDEKLGVSETEPEVESLVKATSNVTISSSSSSLHPHTPSGRATWRERPSKNEDAEEARDNAMLEASSQDWQRNVPEKAYKSILENAVSVARQRVSCGVLESTAVSIQGPMDTKPLPPDTLRDAFAARTLERDFKVGAAGELYIFEYLKGLGLPNFSLENWKSDIRDRVKLHADYHDLEKANDRSAIADIEYMDRSGQLTKFLIQHGHLVEGVWDGEKPFYHIEIKTTTSSDWQEPFFMSKAQERHIQEKRIEDGKSSSSIYIICRIFNLGKGDGAGMHIYLDPETKRRDGELEFSAHTWAVKPLMHRSFIVRNGIARSTVAPTTRTGVTPDETGDDIGINDTERVFRVPSPSPFSFSVTSNIPTSNIPNSRDLSGSSTPVPEEDSPPSMASPFGSTSASSGKNLSTQPSTTTNLFGASSSSSTPGLFSGSNGGRSPNSITIRPPSVRLFGPRPSPSNDDISETSSLFGSAVGSAKDENSKPDTTSASDTRAPNNGAPKVTPPSTGGIFGFGSSNSSTVKGSSVRSLSGSKDNNSSNSASGIFDFSFASNITAQQADRRTGSGSRKRRSDKGVDALRGFGHE